MWPFFFKPGKDCLALCHVPDSADWTLCMNPSIKCIQREAGYEREGLPPPHAPSPGGRRRRAKGQPAPGSQVSAKRLEDLIHSLFLAHDMNSNGYLEEYELVTLNVKIALLHQGQDADVSEVRHKYKELFRQKLDAQGRPVPFAVFRSYALEFLDGLDSDPEAQELILEQFVAEALSACEAMPGILELDPWAAADELIDMVDGPHLWPLLPGNPDDEVFPFQDGQNGTGWEGI